MAFGKLVLKSLIFTSLIYLAIIDCLETAVESIFITLMAKLFSTDSNMLQNNLDIVDLFLNVANYLLPLLNDCIFSLNENINVNDCQLVTILYVVALFQISSSSTVKDLGI